MHVFGNSRIITVFHVDCTRFFGLFIVEHKSFRICRVIRKTRMFFDGKSLNVLQLPEKFQIIQNPEKVLIFDTEFRIIRKFVYSKRYFSFMLFSQLSKTSKMICHGPCLGFESIPSE